MSYEELIAAFGAKYGIEGLESRDGIAALVIDDNKVEFISDEAADSVVIYAEIGFSPPDSNGRFGEVMLKANHLYLGTNGGTLCQNPDTDAYVLMRPVPLSRLEGPEAFGEILENVLVQVESWQHILSGMSTAAIAENEENEEADAFASSGYIQV